MGKNIKFYLKCMKNKRMPYWGLCSSHSAGIIDSIYLFKPISTDKVLNVCYWASGTTNSRHFEFTTLRQTIVLFMAAMNNEL